MIRKLKGLLNGEDVTKAPTTKAPTTEEPTTEEATTEEPTTEEPTTEEPTTEEPTTEEPTTEPFVSTFSLLQAEPLNPVKSGCEELDRLIDELFAKILKEDIIGHLLTELIIFQAAKLDEWADIIPVLIIFFFLSLAHSGQFISYLLGNILGYLLYKTVILQSTSGYVQRQIRTIDDTL